MLHLRVFCPSASTEAIVRTVRANAGTAHVALFPGAAVEPAGDLVEADIARESADELIARLRSQGIDHAGAITLEVLDTALSDAANRAEEDAPGEGADAVVWQELLDRTGEESRLSFTFQAFLTIACLLAVVGVINDSPVTVVGAMVVGPEFGPLAAVAVGLVLRRWDLVRRAAAALAVGFPLAMLVTAGLALVGESAGLLSAANIAGPHEIDFIYQVGWTSLVVALLAGAAGMLSMTSAKSAALVGVFISVTTVPAAGYAVVASVVGEWAQAAESFLQLVVNLLGVVLAAVAVLALRRRHGRSGAGRPLPGG